MNPNVLLERETDNYLRENSWYFKERLVTVSTPFFVFHDLVHKWGLGAKEKIKLTFSWFLLKYLIFKSIFFNALAVLGYLLKLRWAMEIVYSAGFL